MATIIRKGERDFQPHPGKIDGFRLFTDISCARKGINPQYLNFDFRRLDQGQYNAPYHFHRYAEELFLMLSGSATLRTPAGLETVAACESGAHQLHNHTDALCTYLDMCSYIGQDVCEYPDSDKIILVSGGETFRRSEQHSYFEGETDPDRIWEKL